jgi:hypothetical protein
MKQSNATQPSIVEGAVADRLSATSGRDLATVETGGDLAAFAAWKEGRRRGTFRHGGCLG